MNKIAIIGTKELAFQITHYVTTDNQYEVVGYIDNIETKSKIINGRPVLGTVAEAEMLYHQGLFDYVLIAVGYTRFDLRQRFFEELYGKVPFGRFIHSTCYVDPTAKIGDGCVIFPGCILDINSMLKENVFLNWGAGISHDSIIHSHTFIAPKVSLAGCSEIGSRCMIGIGTTIIDNIYICDDVITGGGATVVKNIIEPGIYAGTPAKFLKTK